MASGAGAARRTRSLLRLPWGVAITPDKSKIFLTTAGSQSVTAIDVAAVAENRPRSQQDVRQRSLGLRRLL